MPHSEREPRNPFYLPLLIASLLFAVTGIAWGAVLPILEERARAAGQPAPQLFFRDALREHGMACLLVELAAMVVFGLLSMGLDRLRRLQRERKTATIPPATSDLVPHD